MKLYEDLKRRQVSLQEAQSRWVPNPNPEFEPLWPYVSKFIFLFLAVHGMSIIGSIATLGLMHPLTLFFAVVAFFVPFVVIVTAVIQSKRDEPDDLYLAMLGPWYIRVVSAFLCSIALISSADSRIFILTLVTIIFAVLVIEVLAYLAFRSYSEQEVRKIISEHGLFSDINENNEFWFLNLGGDVGSDRLLIKSKWHLKVFFVIVYLTPLAFVGGGKLSDTLIASVIAISIYFIAHGVFTGAYVVRRGLQLRLEGKL